MGRRLHCFPSARGALPSKASDSIPCIGTTPEKRVELLVDRVSELIAAGVIRFFPLLVLINPLYPALSTRNTHRTWNAVQIPVRRHINSFPRRNEDPGLAPMLLPPGLETRANKRCDIIVGCQDKTFALASLTCDVTSTPRTKGAACAPQRHLKRSAPTSTATSLQQYYRSNCTFLDWGGKLKLYLALHNSPASE